MKVRLLWRSFTEGAHLPKFVCFSTIIHILSIYVYSKKYLKCDKKIIIKIVICIIIFL